MPQSEATQRPPIVLIANDYEWSGRSLETVLTPRGFGVIRAFTGMQALDTARHSQPDALIVDARLPDISGVELCQRLRSEGVAGKCTPIIITSSGRLTREQVVSALAAGAWDVCHYPLDSEMLALRLETFVSAKRESDRIRDEGLIDPATGFYNLRGLVRRGRELAAEALRMKAPLACVAISPVNQPDAGGELDGIASSTGLGTTRELAKALLRCVRGSDVVGHVGRAEFAVIARNANSEGAERLLSRLQASIASEPIMADRVGGVPAIRANYFAVSNYAETALDTLEMLERASIGLRAESATMSRSAVDPAAAPAQSPPVS
jgi:PleD family two-component response regulator